MAQPRRDEPKKFLDAEVQKVQNALLHRAEELDKVKPNLGEILQTGKSFEGRLAAEYRELAKELYHW